MLQWALSLPEGSRETITSIAEKMPEGRTTVRNARRQLEAEGYLHTRRRQDPVTGRWTTQVLVSNVPLREPEAVEAAFGQVAPGDRGPTVGAPAVRAVGTSTKVEKNEEKTPNPPDREADQDVPPERGRAAALLARLGEREPRLRLGAPEAVRLAPLAAAVLAGGVPESVLGETLAAGLPPVVHAPAAFLTHRLKAKLTHEGEERPRRLPCGPLPECEACRDPLPRGSSAGRCRRCTAAGGYRSVAWPLHASSLRS
ncbi:hypothetical protein SCATT_37330 [Streptantibioticus cattleyicolor NRRL 8057 = DSM 46488]|uniref:Helix-turn-helix domain-containing protein n=1 Tax=Streptantibioticus cattleyicolor (strain ATCC 35852 / DSM 46488 / JCM 4925 / NBRC 14057 / NRRL 8057) TaxID=1003195 RepID=G8X2X2_STREN|nr:hypothetical protein SCATT_37330 [Streptantibioticus cattleyicolor NRRL 8057 = DSM 46488]